MQSSSVSFLPEIQSIMYAMGDCRRPLMESAKIIEETLLHEMRQYIRLAQSTAEQRNEQWFGADDLVFVLRNDKILLKRLINSLKVTDIKCKFKVMATTKTEEDDGEALGSYYIGLKMQLIFIMTGQ